METARRLSISEITDRTYMLEDVAGCVALMKRDLAAILRELRTPNRGCVGFASHIFRHCDSEHAERALELRA